MEAIGMMFHIPDMSKDNNMSKKYKQTEEHIRKRNNSKSLKSFYKNNPNLDCGFQEGNQLGRINKGKSHVPWNKGLTKETDKRTMESSVRMKNNNPMRSTKIRKKMMDTKEKTWDRIGRKKHKRSYHTTQTKKYKEWRMAVFMRDSFTCQSCGIKGVLLEAHHIKEWAYYPKLRYIIDNGVTLCQECHKLTRKFHGNQYKNVSHAKHV